MLQARRCSRSQQRGPGRADPLAQQMELRLGEKVTPTPLALPENQGKRRQPRRTSHTCVRCTQHSKTQQTLLAQTHTDTRIESHTIWQDHKECERVESQDTYRHPTTPLQQRHIFLILFDSPCLSEAQTGWHPNSTSHTQPSLH